MAGLKLKNKICNRNRVKKRSAPLLEALEPRMLYSADIVGIVSEPGVEGQVIEQQLDNSLATLTAQLPIPKNTDNADGADDTTIVDVDSETRLEVVFVDTSTPDYQDLLDDLLADTDPDRHFDVILIDADVDGLKLISDTLEGYQGLDAMHLISHGNDGTVNIGNTTLNAETLDQNLADISAWANAFSEDG
ncbi:MAG: hypothetical protein DRQ48_08995, partial [Gammaproteobacteria bacterium]